PVAHYYAGLDGAQQVFASRIKEFGEIAQCWAWDVREYGAMPRQSPARPSPNFRKFHLLRAAVRTSEALSRPHTANLFTTGIPLYFWSCFRLQADTRRRR